MLLAIDIGNTNIVLGVFDGAQLLDSWRLATLRERTADELGLLIDGAVLAQPHREGRGALDHPRLGGAAADRHDAGDDASATSA